MSLRPSRQMGCGMMSIMRCTALVFGLTLTTNLLAGTPVVTPMRVPDGGIQPQLAVDSAGAIHLIYFKGDAKHGDLFYVQSSDTGEHFSPAVRVNSQPGSVLAIGTVRGGQIAVGRGDRPHVIWMGSDLATPRAPDEKGAPLLYARLDDAGKTFEQQRNLITGHPRLDGGLSIAADEKSGDVYAVWHAPDIGEKNEAGRKVWVARSTDDGQHFAAENAANTDPTGACGCCGMRALCARNGTLYITYRSAQAMINRDMYLLTSHDHAATFTSTKLDEMKIGMCVMSTTMLAQEPATVGNDIFAAWETSERIYFSRIRSAITTAPSEVKPSKHPAIATNAAGQILLAWTEGTGWQKGGALAWQLFDHAGKPIANATGRRLDLPAWSLPAVYAKSDGSFVILY